MSWTHASLPRHRPALDARTPAIPRRSARTFAAAPFRGPAPALPAVLALAMVLGLGPAASGDPAAAQVYVADAGGGTDDRGQVLAVDPATGQRILISDLGDPSQGPVALNPRGAVFEAGGTILVAAPLIDEGKLLRVNPSSGARTLVSDFGDPGQGPTGGVPVGVLVEPGGTIIVSSWTDDSLFRVDPTTGARTLLSDFGEPSQGPTATALSFPAIDDGGFLWVSGRDGGEGEAVFRVDPATGNRTLVSDLEDATQGPTSVFAGAVAVLPDGRIVLSASDDLREVLFFVDPVDGTRTLMHDLDPAGLICGAASAPQITALVVGPDGRIWGNIRESVIGGVPGALLAFDPTSGGRSIITCFGDETLGPEGFSPFGIAVPPPSWIFASGFESGDLEDWSSSS
ncbi:MAG: hypothetical protein AAGC60_14215 [Acidobacteriota bacterium]